MTHVSIVNALFQDANTLQTIYEKPTSNWSEDLPAGTTTTSAFLNITSIKGGAGTAYNASQASSLDYARIDGVNGQKGYFTAKTYQENKMTNLGTWLDTKLPPTKITLSITKDFQTTGNGGYIAIGDGQFTFDLLDGPDPETDNVIATKTTPASAAGSVRVVFPEMEFTFADIGDHDFWIVERDGGDPHITYGSPTKITVRVSSSTTTSTLGYPMKVLSAEVVQ
jgi:hypothetical protein